MGIHVKFGTYSCENNELDKTDWLTMDLQWTDCQLVNTDILNPILKVTNGKVSSTYVEIQNFNRFYFVKSVESIVGSHCLLHCHVDVLHTYRSGIKAMECLVARNEDINLWERNLCDKCIPAFNRRIGKAIPFNVNVMPWGELDFKGKFVIGYI